MSAEISGVAGRCCARRTLAARLQDFEPPLGQGVVALQFLPVLGALVMMPSAWQVWTSLTRPLPRGFPAGVWTLLRS